MKTLRNLRWIGALAVLALAIGVMRAPAILAGKNEDPRPVVSCEKDICSIRIEASRDGASIISEPLPFNAASGEIEKAKASNALGNALPGTSAAPIDAWFIGKEENAVEVAIEPIASAGHPDVFIVHQVAGFDHLKRAHVVFKLTGGKMERMASFVEGAGPEILIVAQAEDGLRFHRTAPDGTVTEKTMKFQGSGPDLQLVTVDTE